MTFSSTCQSGFAPADQLLAMQYGISSGWPGDGQGNVARDSEYASRCFKAKDELMLFLYVAEDSRSQNSNCGSVGRLELPVDAGAAILVRWIHGASLMPRAVSHTGTHGESTVLDCHKEMRKNQAQVGVNSERFRREEAPTLGAGGDEDQSEPA